MSVLYSMCFTPDGNSLVAGCEQGIIVWSAKDLLPAWYAQGDTTNKVAVHPSGHLVAAWTNGHHIELWSLHSRRLVATLAVPPDGPGQQPASVRDVYFSSDGGYVLAPTGQHVMGWSVVRTPEKLYLYGHSGGVPRVAFSPEGDLLATVSKDRTARLWDPRTGELRRTLSGHDHPIQDAAFSPDGRYLATGDFGGTVILWDPATGRELTRARVNEAGIDDAPWRLRFGHDGRVLAAGGRGGVVTWTVRADGPSTALVRRGAVAGPPGGAYGHAEFALAPDGREVAFGAGRRGTPGCTDWTVPPPGRWSGAGRLTCSTSTRTRPGAESPSSPTTSGSGCSTGGRGGWSG